MIKIAVLGYGTVGSGVVEVIRTNRESINKRAGEEIQIKYVLDLREFPNDPVQEILVHDYEQIVNDPEVEIVVEVMGGTGAAYNFVKRALEAGKSVSEAEEDMRFKCINAITRIKEPVWERVFSAKVFNDSKKFEKCYRQKMVSILTKYSPYYEKDMEDYDTEGEEDECEQLMTP